MLTIFRKRRTTARFLGLLLFLTSFGTVYGRPRVLPRIGRHATGKSVIPRRPMMLSNRSEFRLLLFTNHSHQRAAISVSLI
jgi:hypothetical protein